MLSKFWTRKCDGNCASTDPHDSHLTRWGRLYFSRWNPRFRRGDRA